MKKIKISALLLACVMIVSLFAGCGSSSTIAKIGDYTLDSDMFEYLIQNVAYMYESQGIGITGMLDQEIMEGTTGADFLKSQALDYAKQNAAIVKLAKENGIALTKDDKASLKADKDAQVEQMGGRKAYLDQIAEAHLTEEAIDEYNELMFLAQKVSTALFSGDGIYAPNADVVAKDLVDNFFRIKHILVIADDTNKAEKKAEAQAILARVAAGEDFDALIAEKGEDPGMQSNTEGYVFDVNGTMFDNSGTMNTEFTTASTALAVGQTSGIVESPNGFHIIKRYPFDEAYVKANIDTYINAYAGTELQAKLDEVMAELEVKTTAAFDEIDLYDLFMIEASTAPQADATAPSVDDAAPSVDDAAPSVDDHAGHDHADATAE